MSNAPEEHPAGSLQGARWKPCTPRTRTRGSRISPTTASSRTRSVLDLRPGREGASRQGGDRRVLDKLIGPNRVFFDVRESFACGSECANVGTVNTVLSNGAIMIVNGVFTYRVDARGKVLALRAYWEMARMKSVAPQAAGGGAQ